MPRLRNLGLGHANVLLPMKMPNCFPKGQFWSSETGFSQTHEDIANNFGSPSEISGDHAVLRFCDATAVLRNRTHILAFLSQYGILLEFFVKCFFFKLPFYIIYKKNQLLFSTSFLTYKNCFTNLIPKDICFQKPDPFFKVAVLKLRSGEKGVAKIVSGKPLKSKVVFWQY